ncbi:DNA internalization-related competence protein ComEC/Rec2 [Sesbania bispinosa]|nr:DNA internalization-related competence protein ComEC/Rec2 [Sesbania bispinosa]
MKWSKKLGQLLRDGGAEGERRRRTAARQGRRHGRARRPEGRTRTVLGRGGCATAAQRKGMEVTLLATGKGRPPSWLWRRRLFAAAATVGVVSFLPLSFPSKPLFFYLNLAMFLFLFGKD